MKRGFQRHFFRVIDWRCRLPVAFLLLLLLYVAAIAFPSVPAPLEGQLDPGWILGLNMAHEQGLVGGRDVIWSYGPLGYLSVPDPASNHVNAAVLYRFVTYSIWLCALARLILTIPSKLVGLWVVLILGVIAVLDPFLPADHLELAIVTVALLPLARHTNRYYWELATLATLAAAAMMVKFNIGIESVGIFVCVFAFTFQKDKHLSRKEILWVVITVALLPVIAMVLYSVATGNILSLSAYLRNSWEIASGYSEGMSLAGPSWEVLVAVLSLAALFAGVPSLAAHRRTLWPGVATAAMCAFFMFKHAMVRHDGHAAPLQAKLALAALFPLVCVVTPRDFRLIAGFQVLSVILGYRINLEWFPGSLPAIEKRFNLEQFRVSVQAFWRWSDTRSLLRDQGEVNLTHLRLDERFHRAISNGSVDAVPWDIASVKANGWTWRPRPVFQSYSAYTPALDRINASHIASKRAADFVLLQWQTIDGRTTTCI